LSTASTTSAVGRRGVFAVFWRNFLGVGHFLVHCFRRVLLFVVLLATRALALLVAAFVAVSVVATSVTASVPTRPSAVAVVRVVPEPFTPVKVGIPGAAAYSRGRRSAVVRRTMGRSMMPRSTKGKGAGKLRRRRMRRMLRVVVVYTVPGAVMNKAWDKVPEALGLGVFLIIRHDCQYKGSRRWSKGGCIRDWFSLEE
jgi:hypothetical protein